MDPARSDVTRFGAPAEMYAAGELLRLHAALVGVPLGPVGDLDRAVAVAGVELWVAYTGVEDLAASARAGTPALLALSRLLQRAAGAGLPVDGFEHTGAITPAGEWLAAFERVEGWLDEWVPEETAAVWERVVADLAADGAGLVGLAAALDDLCR